MDDATWDGDWIALRGVEMPLGQPERDEMPYVIHRRALPGYEPRRLPLVPGLSRVARGVTVEIPARRAACAASPVLDLPDRRYALAVCGRAARPDERIPRSDDLPEPAISPLSSSTRWATSTRSTRRWMNRRTPASSTSASWAGCPRAGPDARSGGREKRRGALPGVLPLLSVQIGLGVNYRVRRPIRCVAYASVVKNAGRSSPSAGR